MSEPVNSDDGLSVAYMEDVPESMKPIIFAKVRDAIASKHLPNWMEHFKLVNRVEEVGIRRAEIATAKTNGVELHYLSLDVQEMARKLIAEIHDFEDQIFARVMEVIKDRAVKRCNETEYLMMEALMITHLQQSKQEFAAGGGLTPDDLYHWTRCTQAGSVLKEQRSDVAKCQKIVDTFMTRVYHENRDYETEVAKQKYLTRIIVETAPARGRSRTRRVSFAAEPEQYSMSEPRFVATPKLEQIADVARVEDCQKEDQRRKPCLEHNLIVEEIPLANRKVRETERPCRECGATGEARKCCHLKHKAEQPKLATARQAQNRDSTLPPSQVTMPAARTVSAQAGHRASKQVTRQASVQAPSHVPQQANKQVPPRPISPLPHYQPRVPLGQASNNRHTQTYKQAARSTLQQSFVPATKPSPTPAKPTQTTELPLDPTKNYVWCPACKSNEHASKDCRRIDIPSSVPFEPNPVWSTAPRGNWARAAK